ncbi:innexin inx2-like [Schistocerca cancellata]|uniref:innexin inx2-like n=1 Tax=Schistocerca cancellata TaxID=274614 RepID=UPI002118D8B2|nr:innexin inx2-like [Schistocerca cancellata]
MLSSVSSLKGLLEGGPRVDNWACWLHHGLTFAALLLCSVVVSARQYVGDPIDCLFRGAGEHRTLDAYCWVQSTFTSARALDPDEERAHPGVGPEAPGEPMRHHAYYRWVCYVLLFQAAASVAPHCLWRAYEGGAAASAATKEHCVATPLTTTRAITVPGPGGLPPRTKQIRGGQHPSPAHAE